MTEITENDVTLVEASRSVSGPYGRRGQNTTTLIVYDVVFDGRVVGQVGRHLKEYAKDIPGKRYVAYYYKVPRWYAIVNGGYTSRGGAYESKKAALKDLLAQLSRREAYPEIERRVAHLMAEQQGDWRDFTIETLGEGTLGMIREKIKSERLTVENIR